MPSDVTPDDFNDDAILINARPRLKITAIRNQILQDDRISFRAKGIACYLLSKPDGWKPHVKDIQNHGTEGRDAIRNALKELRTYGYAHYQSLVPGRQTAQWSISDVPVFKNLENEGREPENPSAPDDTFEQGSAARESASGTREPENPAPGNQGLYRKPKNKRESKDSLGQDQPQKRLLTPLTPLASEEEKPELAAPVVRNTKRRTPVAKGSNPWVAFCEAAVVCWNGNRRMTWPEVSTLTGRERKDLGEFWAFFDKDLDRAVAGFAQAVSWANKQESWTDGKVLTLAELLANSKLIQYAQKAFHTDSKRQEAASVTAHGVRVRVGQIMAYQGSYNVKVLTLDGTVANVENVQTKQRHVAYADELGAPL